MRLTPKARTPLKWAAGLLAVALVSLLTFQTAAHGLDREALPHQTFETLAAGLALTFALILELLRRSPRPDPSRGGELARLNPPRR